MSANAPIAILHAAEIVSISQSHEARKCGRDMQRIAVIADGAILIRDGRIDWLGPSSELPPLPATTEVLDARGKIILPGFIDSHTHLIFAGSRANEFEQRLQGLSYQEIAARGGGINATVQRVRHASKEELKELARPRL